jgi:hypothetical protein
MSEKSFKREFAEEMFLKVAVKAAPIAVGVVLSPLGLGAVAAAAAIVNLASKSAQDASQSKETGSG